MPVKFYVWFLGLVFLGTFGKKVEICDDESGILMDWNLW